MDACMHAYYYRQVAKAFTPYYEINAELLLTLPVSFRLFSYKNRGLPRSFLPSSLLSFLPLALPANNGQQVKLLDRAKSSMRGEALANVVAPPLTAVEVVIVKDR